MISISELYKIYLQHPSVQTDTRKLKQGDIFFALKGPSFNGNLFAKQALEQGAAYAVIDEDISNTNEHLLPVDDVLTTLQNLAKHHREQLTIPFIGITGSNGKTTTKELVHAVLSKKYTTYTTKGNLNNHIGVPLTILSVKPDAEIAVIEMGANHLKEIAGYCMYAEPTHGIITNCGKAHLEGFGSLEGVRKGKGELYDYLRAHNGVAFAFDDYDYLHDMSAGIKEVIWYGTAKGALTGNAADAGSQLEVNITGGLAIKKINTQLIGTYNLPNVLCAALTGKYFNVHAADIKAAIENYTPSNSRSQLIDKGSNKIILDAYNANPSSMKAAVENFAGIDHSKKILMLGAMMEMGNESVSEHQQLVALIDKNKWSNVVLVGKEFKAVANGYNYFDNSTDAAAWFKQQQFEDAYILIKGSRSMMMEKIIE